MINRMCSQVGNVRSLFELGVAVNYADDAVDIVVLGFIGEVLFPYYVVVCLFILLAAVYSDWLLFRQLLFLCLLEFFIRNIILLRFGIVGYSCGVRFVVDNLYVPIDQFILVNGNYHRSNSFLAFYLFVFKTFFCQNLLLCFYHSLMLSRNHMISEFIYYLFLVHLRF